jgi:predicted GNAT family acetyltransferase
LHPLDNPVWNALISADKHLNQGNEHVAYLNENIAPFVGMPYWEPAHQSSLQQLLPPHRSWSVMIANPVIFESFCTLRFTTNLFQMVCRKPSKPKTNSKKIRLLTAKDVKEMVALTALTKPGPFLTETISMGNYYGAFENNQLVSMAGERFHLTGYSEISAVCTHPAYTGKGLGTQLVAHMMEEIIKQGKTPFLHVRVDNLAAIQLYEKLGFQVRREMYFAVFNITE